MRVRVPAHWARDLRNGQLPTKNNGFDAAALDSAMISLNADNATNEMDSNKLPKLKPDDWDIWEPAFVSRLKFRLKTETVSISQQLMK